MEMIIVQSQIFLIIIRVKVLMTLYFHACVVAICNKSQVI